MDGEDHGDKLAVHSAAAWAMFVVLGGFPTLEESEEVPRGRHGQSQSTPRHGSTMLPQVVTTGAAGVERVGAPWPLGLFFWGVVMHREPPYGYDGVAITGCCPCDTFCSTVPNAPVPVPSVFWGPSHTVRGPNFLGARPYLEGASVLSAAGSGALGACVPGGRLVVTRSVVFRSESWSARASPPRVSAACAAHPTASLGAAPGSRAGWSPALCVWRASPRRGRPPKFPPRGLVGPSRQPLERRVGGSIFHRH